MSAGNDLSDRWLALPEGAHIAFEEQWAGVAARGLPCGSSIIDAHGNLVGRGRNRAYDPAGDIDSRMQYPLQHNRLAHAEINALALVPTEVDHASLTLWTTQHPCSMCAAALAFIGVGSVHYIADDPSDTSSPEERTATHKAVRYSALGDPFWWTVSNLLFLYTSAVLSGEDARNIALNHDRYPELVQLGLKLAAHDALGVAARSGASLPEALGPYLSDIEAVAAHAPV